MSDRRAERGGSPRPRIPITRRNDACAPPDLATTRQSQAWMNQCGFSAMATVHRDAFCLHTRARLSTYPAIPPVSQVLRSTMTRGSSADFTSTSPCNGFVPIALHAGATFGSDPEAPKCRERVPSEDAVWLASATHLHNRCKLTSSQIPSLTELHGEGGPKREPLLRAVPDLRSRAMIRLATSNDLGRCAVDAEHRASKPVPRMDHIRSRLRGRMLRMNSSPDCPRGSNGNRTSLMSLVAYHAGSAGHAGRTDHATPSRDAHGHDRDT